MCNNRWGNENNVIQLRNIYSIFDENNNANKPKLKGPNYKPLIDKLYNLNNSLYWLLPIVNIQKKVYIEELQQDLDDYIYVKNNSIVLDIININELYNNYLSNSVSIDNNKYNYLYNQLDKLNTPYYNINKDSNFTHNINNPILGIINNYDEFDTDTVSDDIVQYAEDTTTLLNKYIDELDIELDKDRLKGIMRGLYNEAQDLEL